MEEHIQGQSREHGPNDGQGSHLQQGQHRHGHDSTHDSHLHEHGEHDHAHESGHSHESSLELSYATVELSSHLHDQAATVSATIKLNGNATTQFAQLASAMQEIANRAEAAGGIVGHIKGYADSSQGFVSASCTDASQGVDVKGDPGLTLDATSKIQLVAIVMLLDLDSLQNIIASALA